MATITGYGSKHSHEFKLTVNETSSSITNNTSEVSFSFTIYKASYSWSQWNSITYTITINDVSYTGTIPSYSAGSTMTIRSGSQTISHNSDGTKSINYSFSVNDGSGQSYTCGNASASGNFTLTTIPRASSINGFFGNNIESYFSVNYTSYYSGFTNKLRISIPNIKELENFTYTSGSNFKLSTETLNYLYEYMKNSKTVNIGAVIETWNGSTKIGESIELVNTCFITGCEPTIESVNYLDTSEKAISVTGDNQKIIRNFSNLMINLNNLKSLKGATLIKCQATINGITKDFSNISGNSIETTSLDFGTIDTSTNIDATIVLTDSRGYTDTKTITINILNYINLSINATIKRIQPTTGEVGITFSGNYFNGSFGSTSNTLTLNWYYREKGSSTWITGGTLKTLISKNTYTNGTSIISLGKMFEYQKSYEFYLEVADKLTTLQPTFLVTQGIPIFNWGEDFVNFMKKVLLNGTNILDKIDGVVLYNDENGTTGTVTLSETSANFNYLEIFYKKNDTDFYKSQRVYSPDGKKVVLDLIYTPNGYEDLVQVNSSIYSISGTSITKVKQYAWNLGKDNAIIIESTCQILKVVGYR